MRYKNLQDLQPGELVAMPIIGPNGQILLKPGVPLTQAIISSLEKYGYSGVTVNDSSTKDIIYKSQVPIETKMAAIQASKSANIEDCLYISGSIADELMETNGIAKSALEDLGNSDASTASHSVSVAIYAGTVAVLLGYSYVRVQQVIEAALLHDIGKLQISEEIIKKEGSLTIEEFEEIKKHPRYGYEMLKNLESVASVVRVSVLQHHENVDGTGYPMGLYGKDIYEYAKIIHICDVYDALVSKRCYKEKISPTSVIEYINARAGEMFDEKITKVFLRSIAPFPEGARVSISNGEFGIVKKLNPEWPAEPIVLLDSGKDLDVHYAPEKIVNIVY